MSDVTIYSDVINTLAFLVCVLMSILAACAVIVVLTVRHEKRIRCKCGALPECVPIESYSGNKKVIWYFCECNKCGKIGPTRISKGKAKRAWILYK